MADAVAADGEEKARRVLSLSGVAGGEGGHGTRGGDMAAKLGVGNILLAGTEEVGGVSVVVPVQSISMPDSGHVAVVAVVAVVVVLEVVAADFVVVDLLALLLALLSRSCAGDSGKEVAMAMAAKNEKRFRAVKR